MKIKLTDGNSTIPLSWNGEFYVGDCIYLYSTKPEDIASIKVLMMSDKVDLFSTVLISKNTVWAAINTYKYNIGIKNK